MNTKSVNDTIYPINDNLGSRPSHGSAGKYLERLRPLVASRHFKEIAYQIVIAMFLFVFFSFELDETKHQSLGTLFEPSKLFFFINYLVASMLVNYGLLPKFYYRKRAIAFVIALTVLITVVILIDEFILEQIFFPDTRGTHFPGLMFTLVETLPIIIVFVAFKLAWDYNVKQSELERLKNSMKETELQFLKSQINPHFLFNNLNNLYAHAIENSSKTPSIILELSAVLRYMLYECQANFVALNTEIQHLENYANLNQLQLGNRGRINVNKEINGIGFAIPPLILIVFVENAFKHSTQSLLADIQVDISLKVSKEGKLTFTCKNNYAFQYRPSTADKGIGLENVKKRLSLQYRNEHQLDIKADGSTYAATLIMQLKKSGQK